MSAKKITPTADDDGQIAAFNEAVASPQAAEATLRRAQERADELEARASDLDNQATGLDRQRGDALARGQMDDAASIGRKWAQAHDGAKAARREAEALRRAIPDLEIDLLDAEEAALAAHRRVHRDAYDVERAALMDDLRPKLLRLWRSFLACGWNMSAADFCAGIAREAAPNGKDGINPLTVALASPLPIAEDRPASPLLGHGFNKRLEVADRRELRNQRAA